MEIFSTDFNIIKLFIWYLMIYIFLIIFNYLIPVGLIYFLFYKNHINLFPKIQKTESSKFHRKLEIKHSFISLNINAFLVLIALVLFLKGHSKIYLNIEEKGWLYFFTSPFIALILHDTYFYWMHRMEHIKFIFKRIHRVHHYSKTPTPWAIFSFDLPDAFLNTIFPVGIIFIIPFHPIALLFYYLFNLSFNIIGHLGYEVFPIGWGRNPILKWFSSASNHDMHHVNPKVNFGLYFCFWDYLMKTYDKKQSG